MAALTVPERFARLAKPRQVESWTLAPSTRAGKKWMVTIVPANGLGRARAITVHFGDSSMQDYTQHHDKERRRRFHQRFAALIAATRNNPLSPMYYTARLLW
jgi:Family of unknown function (DUF5754)